MVETAQDERAQDETADEPAQVEPAQGVDKRAEYYEERLRQHGEQYGESHRRSLEVLLNLLYTGDQAQTRLARHLASYGLSPSGFNVLSILKSSRQAECPLHELGELLLVSKANITGVVDSLEQRGLVARVTCQEDRRIRLARITEAGFDLVESILPSHYAEIRDMCSNLTDSEKALASQLLAKLRLCIQKANSECMRKKIK
jgi:MarR family 2-MHQ and catechol resistance regulon transcriptional repressor